MRYPCAGRVAEYAQRATYQVGHFLSRAVRDPAKFRPPAVEVDRVEVDYTAWHLGRSLMGIVGQRASCTRTLLGLREHRFDRGSRGKTDVAIDDDAMAVEQHE